MKATTLPRYLAGSRAAILEIASSRWSFWIGALFVLSAGLAREYDGEDLIHEPWHALRPLGASLVSGTVLFLIVHGAALLRGPKAEGEEPRFGRAYLAFMALFWMTAPMAWLYAIPYERFMSPVGAVSTNLWTLALVAAWRVGLMTRVVNVLYGINGFAAFFLVMLFADAVAFVAISSAPGPVIDVMGGVRSSAREAYIAQMTFLLGVLALLSAPVWIIGGVISAATMKPKWSFPPMRPGWARAKAPVVTAVVSLLAFGTLLAVGQPEQVRRRAAERLLEGGDVAAGLAELSRRSPDEYPPHWEPPPRLGYGEREPSLNAVREAMDASWPAPWVAEAYLEKIRGRLQRDLSLYPHTEDWAEILAVFEREGTWIVEATPETVETIGFLLRRDDSLTDADREALQRIAAIVREAIEEAGPDAPDRDEAPAAPARDPVDSGPRTGADGAAPKGQGPP